MALTADGIRSPASGVSSPRAMTSRLPRCRPLTFPVAILLPGLIDIHCHGEMGRDVMEANVGAFEAVRR